jgi:hypothetical protein
MNNPADELSQAFKRKILAEDRDRLSTYRAHAEANADLELGGRYSKVTTVTVTGASPTHQYPRLPLSAPSNQAMMVPDEPPLGIDINAMDPVGEAHEQKASEARPKSRLRRL